MRVAIHIKEGHITVESVGVYMYSGNNCCLY